MVAIHHPMGYLAENGRMLTISEVANFLGAHVNSVRRWADMGLLPSYRIGLRGDRRFRSDEVSGFLFSRKQG